MLAKLSDNERQKYQEILNDDDFLNGGKRSADDYLRTVSRMKVGQSGRGMINYQTYNYEISETKSGDKVYKINGKYYALDNSAFPNFKKQVPESEIKK